MAVKACTMHEFSSSDQNGSRIEFALRMWVFIKPGKQFPLSSYLSNTLWIRLTASMKIVRAALPKYSCRLWLPGMAYFPERKTCIYLYKYLPWSEANFTAHSLAMQQSKPVAAGNSDACYQSNAAKTTSWILRSASFHFPPRGSESDKSSTWPKLFGWGKYILYVVIAHSDHKETKLASMDSPLISPPLKSLNKLSASWSMMRAM